MSDSTAWELPAYIKRFAVRGDDGIHFVPTDQVDWIEGAQDYVRLHGERGVFLIRSTMRVMAEQLDPQEFVRIHRSFIVRIDRISHLTPMFHGDFAVHLLNGTQLRMSRSYRSQVQARLAFGL